MKGLVRHLLHPAWHALKRDGVNRAMRELENNQWLSTSELLDLQQRKLEQLLRFAGRHVPYYMKLFQERRIRPDSGVSRDDFARLTPLTKAIIRRESEALVSENLADNKLIANSTSGSTGQAIQFFTDTRSVAYRAAAEIRSNGFAGWQLGDRWATLWGAPMDIPLGRALRSRLRGIVNRRIFLSSFDLSSERLDNYAHRIREFRPKLLVGYPGPLEALASHCKENRISLPSLTAVVSSAETLWPHQREVIEGAFSVKVFDRYGSREVGQVGSECEYHNGMHISIDRVLVEVLDDQGNPCVPGQIGRILVTDLDNFGMPLIRYDIGDRGVPTDEHMCQCRRGFPKIEKIEGRTLEVVETPNGHRIGGTFWTLLLRSRPGLAQFQVVQSRANGIVIRYVRDREVEQPAFEYFSEKIREKCGPAFLVEFSETDQIDLTAAGKQRLIISYVSGQSASEFSDVKDRP